MEFAGRGRKRLEKRTLRLEQRVYFMVSKTACTLALMGLVTDCMEMFFYILLGWVLSCIIIIRFGDSGHQIL